MNILEQKSDVMKTTFQFLTLCCFLLLFQSALSAQISLGARAGYNGSIVNVFADDPNETITSNYRYSFNYALLVNIGLGKFLSLQPEVSYIEKGAIFELPDIDIPIPFFDLPDVYFDVQYIEIPVLLKFKVGEGMASAFAELGPTLAIGLDNGLQILNFTNPIPFGENDLRRADIGATGGIGIQVNSDYGSVFIHGRYAYSFTDLEGFTEDLGGGLENFSGWNAGIGYLYTFKGKNKE